MRCHWVALVLSGASIQSLTGCSKEGHDASPPAIAEPLATNGAASANSASTGTAPKAPSAPGACGNLTLTFGATVPADFGISNQTDADCFAWQEFIALNWPTVGNSFGAPGDLSEVQWQGYMDDHQLFQPAAAPPPPWGTPPLLTADCQKEARLTDAQARKVHPLVDATKFSSEFLSSADSAEAFPSGAPAWIGDVNGNNVWFEVLVNEDEYNFVVQNQFYNAQKQLAFYTNQNPVAIPLQLPAGCNASSACPKTQTGALEVKAAWMEVPDPSNAKWNAYKLSTAVVVDATTQKCEQVTVALVAFHILHKTQSQPTWVWATFEQKNNAPNAGAPNTQVWNFNNPQCTPTTVQVPPACQVDGGASVVTTCTPNTPPQYDIGDGCPDASPTQVTRVNAIDPTATSVNATAQAAIQNASNGSVWQNYVLVNVVWSANPPVIPPACTAGNPGCQGLTTPQLTQSLNPSGAVANTVLETYIQDHNPKNAFAKSNCILCHQFASVPTAPPATPYASDFSFAMGEAQSPPGAPKLNASSKAAPGKHPRRKIRRIFR
jgi:hypothetical protein